jgi:hypothetical protein
MVKRGKRARKLLISSSSESAISFESEEDGRWGTESEDEVVVECLYYTGLFSEDHGDDEWIPCQKCLKWRTLFVQTIRQEHLCVKGARNDSFVYFDQ